MERGGLHLPHFDFIGTGLLTYMYIYILYIYAQDAMDLAKAIALQPVFRFHVNLPGKLRLIQIGHLWKTP